MNIKSKIRSIVGDLLAKTGSFNADRGIIKNVVLNPYSVPSELNKGHLGGFIRILATDIDNAKQIQKQLELHKNELPFSSIHIADQPINHTNRPHKPGHFDCSVIVKVIPSMLAQSSLRLSQEGALRNVVVGDGGKSERVVIDFSSPNVAKPFHFGHLKSTILGNFIANINQYLGNQVTKVNYIGDWGTQYGLLSLGLEKFGDEEDESSSPLRKLLNVYVRANEVSKNDASFHNEAKRRFLLLDKSIDSEQFDLWRQIRDLSLEELKNSYERLGITFDAYEFESDYAKSSTSLVERMKVNDLVVRADDGLMSVTVIKNESELQIPIQKSDGASLYLTRDLAAAISRKERYNFDKMLYVVGSDQEKHFFCLAEIAKKLGYDWHNRLVHVKMGKVVGMSSRSGKFVLLSDIIAEATKRYIEATKNTPTSKVNNDAEIEEVGRHLALTAMYVYDMRRLRTSNYEFDWDLVMNEKSKSGINLQTSYARLANLLDRASSIGLEPYNCSNEMPVELDKSINSLEAMNLLSVLNEFDTVMQHSYHSLDPSYLVWHAMNLCKVANRARQSEKLWVLGERNEEIARIRLSLFKMAHSQLELAIKLIGLKPLTKV